MIETLLLTIGLVTGWISSFVVLPWALRSRLGQRLTKKYRKQPTQYPDENFGTVQMRQEAISALGQGARYEEANDGRRVALLVTHPTRQGFHTTVARAHLQRGRQAIVAKLRDPAFVKSLAEKK